MEASVSFNTNKSRMSDALKQTKYYSKHFYEVRLHTDLLQHSFLSVDIREECNFYLQTVFLFINYCPMSETHINSLDFSVSPYI